jgi:hypothetical protein
MVQEMRGWLRELKFEKSSNNRGYFRTINREKDQAHLRGKTVIFYFSVFLNSAKLGSYYVGDWLGSKKRTILQPKKRQILNHSLDGRGRHYWADKSWYEGEWKDDRRK